MKLPEQLEPYRNRKIWVCYVRVKRTTNGKYTKPPINPRTLCDASSTNAETWGTYDECAAQIEKIASHRTKDGRIIKRPIEGVGINLEGTELLGVDLDGVIIYDADGKYKAKTEAADDIIHRLNSYTEVSPSGTGLHVLIKAVNPNSDLNTTGTAPKGIKIHNEDGTEFEMYDNGRYFTVTGIALKGCPGIEERQEEVNQIFREWDEKRKAAKVKAFSSVVSCGGSGDRIVVSEDDTALWKKMFNSKCGREIKALYSGDLGAYGDNHSRADLALCNHLAYWTNCDSGRIDRMFRQTGLMRPKWNNNGYRQRTINLALERGAYKGYTAEEKKAYAQKKEAEEEAAIMEGFRTWRKGHNNKNKLPF